MVLTKLQRARVVVVGRIMNKLVLRIKYGFANLSHMLNGLSQVEFHDIGVNIVVCQFLLFCLLP